MNLLTLLGTTQQKANSKDRLVHLLIRGQSQADGYLSTPALSTATMPNVFALGPEVNGRTNFYTNFANSDLVPLQEYDVNATRAETIATAMAQQIMTWANDPNLTIVVSNHSQNSQTIADLSKGGASGAYERSISAVERVSEIAASEGKSYECHMLWYHGGAGANPYGTQLQTLINDFRTDVAPYTSQESIKVFIDQQREAGDPDYSIQSLDVANADPDVIISHPRYTVEYTGDNVHLTNHGSRNSAVLFAQSIYKTLYSSYAPFELSQSLTVLNGDLIIPLNGIEGTVQGTGDFGLEVYDITNGATIPGTFTVTGGNRITFSPTTPVNAEIVVEIRSQLGASGTLYSESDLVSTFNDAGSNPYSLHKYLLRNKFMQLIDFTAGGTSHTLSLTENQNVVIDIASISGIVAGDTIIVPAGNYLSLRIINSVGTAAQPIRIINDATGIADFNGSNYGLNIETDHVLILGIGSTDPQGFDFQPDDQIGGSVGISGKPSGVEIAYCRIHDTGFAGLFLKGDDLSSDPSTWRENFEMTGLKIHHNVIENTGGEGMYIGTTSPPASHAGQIRLPHLITGLEIYDNVLNNLGWDGIQASRCPDHKIYRNQITNYGLENQSGQNKGIAIANESTGECYNNFIKTGTGNGIDCFGGADNKIHHNIIIDAGEYGMFINDNSIEADYPGYESGAITRPGYTLAAYTIIRPAQYGFRINCTDIDNKRVLNNIVREPGVDNVSIANAGLTLDEQGNVYDTVANLLFVDAANDDYNLGPGSPARDVGIDLTSYNITVDYAGTARPINTIYDAGAFEGALVVAAPTTVNLDANTIGENNAINAVIGILSSDGANITSYNLGGTDAASFNINNNQLRASIAFDFETKSSYSITLSATNAGGTSNPIAFTINITDVVEGTTPSSIRQVPINSESNGSTNNPRGYIEYLPEDFDTRNDWQLITWHHGLGEAGNGDSDLAGLLDHALLNYLNNGNDIGYVAVFPQSFNGYFGANRLHDWIEWVEQRYAGKITKIHGACVSASGAGFDNLALNYSATLAKLETVTFGAALTGNGASTQYNNFVAGNVRTWWHHGDADVTVGYGATLNYYEGIVQAFGGQNFDNHRYTLYSGLGHSAWQETYDNSGRDKPQVTGQISALVGDYFFWQAPDTWYEFLEGTAPPPVAPSNLQLDNTSINEEATGVVGNLTVQGSPTPVLSITVNDNLFSLQGNNQLNLDVAQDYETMGAVKQVQVEVTATNSEGSISQTFDIDINDIAEGVAPTNVFLSVNNIDENNSINDVIGLLSADGDDPKTFAISGTDGASFNTNGNEFRASEAFDFETKSSYSIFITATNSFGSSAPIPFTININDVNESGGDELIGVFNLGRASRPQVNESIYPDYINVNENIPQASDPAISAFGLTFNVTEDFSSTPNVTYDVPSDLHGFPIELWQNGWYDRFNGRIDVDDYNDSDLYKFRIPVNIDRTTDTSIEIKINGVVVYSNLVHPQGATATVVEVANVAPVAGNIYFEIGGVGAAPIGERFGGVCAIQMFRQL
ncbi:MAG: right-handed parallel beta-helix repeat-containing protein [Fulvivirga sp.]